MNSLILKTAANVLLPVMVLLSIIVLLRGHNEPGGGFVGGLLAASGLALHALAHGDEVAGARLRVRPHTIIGLGLLVAAGAGLPGLVAGEPFLKGLWTSFHPPGFPEALKIGTPLMFDIGVYMLVLGGTSLMVLSLEELRDESDTGR
jgi:multicomponent Na+:H+ antiporter subunit B